MKPVNCSSGSPLGIAFFTLCMGAVIWFFIIAGNTHSWSSWVYSAFLMYLYIRMILTGNVSRYRRIFQVVFALLFAVSFIGILMDERNSMVITDSAMITAELPFCQIVIPQSLLPLLLTGSMIFPARVGGHFASISGMLLIWIIVTLTIGRGWCSWVCFYGGWEEGFSRFGKKPRLKILSRNRDIRAFQFAFFAFIALVSLMTLAAVYCEWFCPFKLVTEFVPVTDLVSLAGAVMFIGLFLALVVVLPILTGKRTQCSALCPFGAFQSLAGRVSVYRISIDTDMCTGCMKCAKLCPFCAIDEETIRERRGRPEITCALCGECVSACPSGAINWRYTFSGGKAKTQALSPGMSALRRFGRTLIEPRQVFLFSGFTFSVIISSDFAVDGLNRIASLFGFGG